MKNIKIIIFVLCVGFKTSAQTLEKVNPNRIPVSSLQTLLLTNNPSNGALGNAGVASAPDITNWTINVAKNAFQTEKNAISISYMPNETRLIRGMAMYSITGYSALKKEKFGTISYNVSNYNFGSAELRDDNANYLGTHSSNELSLKIGYSKRLGNYTSGGIAIGYYRSNLFGSQTLLDNYFKPASGLNADIGFYRNGYNKAKDGYFNYGASIINIGGKVRYGDEKMQSYAPIQFRIGSSYNYFFDSSHEDKFSFNLDMTKDLIPTPKGSVETEKTKTKSELGIMFSSWADAPNGFKEEMQELRFHIGAEYLHKNTLAVRAGYQHENKYKGDRKQLGFGLGLHEMGSEDIKFNVDASYSFSVFSSTAIAPTFRLSIGAYFGGKKVAISEDDQIDSRENRKAKAKIKTSESSPFVSKKTKKKQRYLTKRF